MAEEKLEVTKLRERIGYGIEIVEAAAKAKGLAFDKETFLEGCKLGETLWVRSEITFASRNRN